MKTKNQQIQFFKDCLLPQYSIDYSEIDFESYVDSTLTTRENWRILKEEYSLGKTNSTGEIQFLEQKIMHLAERLEEVELRMEELTE